MYTIARYTYLIDAQLNQLKLSQYGVDSFIADEYTVTMQWFYANAIGGIRLQVSELDAKDAIEILNLVDAVSDDTLLCQKCNSADTFRMRMSFWSFPLYLIGVFFPIPSNKVICMSCGSKVTSPNKTERPIEG
jgi:hypothetical protein